MGAFSAQEIDILKPELEKRGIPVKVVYPGTNVGAEAAAHARWTACTIMIREIDIETALEICDSLNIRARDKISLPKLLYTRVNRYVFGLVVAILLTFIVLGNLGIIQNASFVGVLVGTLFLKFAIRYFSCETK